MQSPSFSSIDIAILQPYLSDSNCKHCQLLQNFAWLAGHKTALYHNYLRFHIKGLIQNDSSLVFGDGSCEL